jgi:hypothetical protein
MLRSFLLAPCLLICLACATPFPIESLEEGMTVETVREKFGEPVAIGVDPPFDASAGTFWAYMDQKLVISAVIIGWPWAPLFVAVSWLPNFEWNDPYMSTSDVVLHFEQEKLARWEVIEPPPVVSSGISEHDWDWMNQQQWNRSKDERHHKKGHKHHHHDC